ncbi:Methyltransferase domain containing protein [Lotmaria passim]
MSTENNCTAQASHDKRLRAEAAPPTGATEGSPVHPSPSIDAVAYERQYVHDVYSAIADHFSSTRYKAWPCVAAFLEALPPFSLIADMGCGNGKYFAAAQRLAASAPLSSEVTPPLPSLAKGEKAVEGQRPLSSSPSSSILTHRYMVGLDYSEELLRSTQRPLMDPNMYHEQARRQHRSRRARKLVENAMTPVSAEAMPRTDTVRSDALRSPLRGGLFDAAISIAVIHHYATHDRRVRAVRELLRLVRPHGGLVLIYVWARDESGHAKRPMDPETGDSLVRWERNQKYDEAQQVFHRYYHFFSEGELERLCTEASASADGDKGVPVTIRASYFDKENWCVVLERK